jgi:hypothetical protein
MTERTKVSSPFRGAADQMIVKHLGEAIARTDSMTVSHLRPAVQKIEKQLTVSHLAPALGSGSSSSAPTQEQGSSGASSSQAPSGNKK